MRKILLSLPMVATLVLALFVAVIAFGRAADSRNHLASFEGQTGPFEIIVGMRFEPEAFHLSAFQAAGRIAGVDGTQVHLRAVKMEELHTLSRRPWVASIQTYSEGEES